MFKEGRTKRRIEIWVQLMEQIGVVKNEIKILQMQLSGKDMAQREDHQTKKPRGSKNPNS